LDSRNHKEPANYAWGGVRRGLNPHPPNLEGKNPPTSHVVSCNLGIYFVVFKPERAGGSTSEPIKPRTERYASLVPGIVPITMLEEGWHPCYIGMPHGVT
jgi:hypothetical protein